MTVTSVLSHCNRNLKKQAQFSCPSFSCTYRSWDFIRFYAAPATSSKAAKKEKEKEQSKSKLMTKDELEEKRKDTSRPKPYGLTAWKPTDDVYVACYYPKPLLEVETAIDMLKTFQKLDFTYEKQPVYVELQLDMKLEKKKKVDPFVGYLKYPYPFSTVENKVLVFTENPDDAQIARDNGAAFVGGSEFIQQILDDEIQADFYIATPEIVPKLIQLKNKLRKKFPKSKRGSVGRDIPKMLQLFKTGHEYLVEKECLVQTKIATLDMPQEHIVANLDALIKDICTYRPLSYGPFVERVILTSATSEALFIRFQQFLPQETEKAASETSVNSETSTTI
ncbi:39S ribosomal protein L1, mitochondrial isoform X2 [Xenopus laevis]|uniref:Large ribosomal subunit protein uL1m n=1 Tax=Xenopus laevis TaxID=8355 RepID=A0A8J0URP6_XENLA|nr:39S ribosomal protein L1, mitochondrial isoform X2 [Xenopus laevis]